jgi:hypothetical protein
MPPGQPFVPGRVIVTGAIPTNLGAGTNEDVILVAHLPSLLLVARNPTFRVFEETGSGTATIRVSSWATAALLTKHPAAVAKVVSLPPPSGF